MPADDRRREQRNEAVIKTNINVGLISTTYLGDADAAADADTNKHQRGVNLNNLSRRCRCRSRCALPILACHFGAYSVGGGNVVVRMLGGVCATSGGALETG